MKIAGVESVRLGSWRAGIVDRQRRVDPAVGDRRCAPSCSLASEMARTAPASARRSPQGRTSPPPKTSIANAYRPSLGARAVGTQAAIARPNLKGRVGRWHTLTLSPAVIEDANAGASRSAGLRVTAERLPEL
jgi:hypothetical protein